MLSILREPLPKPDCRQCGKPCPKAEAVYCSRHCYGVSMRKNPTVAPRVPQKKVIARGTPKGLGGMLQTMTAFDVETFAELRQMAIDADTSFAEQVRLMVEWGLEERRAQRRNAAD